MDHDYVNPSIKDHGVTVDSCNQHKERKREREEEKDGGTNAQHDKNPNGAGEANRSEVMPQKRIRKPSLKVKEMKETRDAVVRSNPFFSPLNTLACYVTLASDLLVRLLYKSNMPNLRPAGQIWPTTLFYVAHQSERVCCCIESIRDVRIY